ncbi:hypothetical protein BXZ70DRAFT_141214 [Cristinia sonorae]|uniref:Uncharacterized protein n=1 Tax=Cristinia sonorae TaxID=1940300 RepID=A0A8K0XQA1_9AGAR|nr:hypothetical protein BXZ70DRAFT_141214 [Cristinia sonorae]
MVSMPLFHSDVPPLMLISFVACFFGLGSCAIVYCENPSYMRIANEGGPGAGKFSSDETNVLPQIRFCRRPAGLTAYQKFACAPSKSKDAAESAEDAASHIHGRLLGHCCASNRDRARSR